MEKMPILPIIICTMAAIGKLIAIAEKLVCFGVITLVVLIAAVCFFCLSHAHVWTDDRGIVHLGDHSCSIEKMRYDSKTRTLIPTNARLGSAAHGAAIYTLGDLRVAFSGPNVISGKQYGFYVHGKLTLTGENSADISEKTNKISARDAIDTTDPIKLSIRGEKRPIVSGTSCTGTVPFYTALDVYETTVQVLGSRFLHLWQPDRLRFDTVGGGVLPNEELRYATPKANLPVPTCENFDFKGWYTDTSYRKIYEAVPLTRDTILCARREKRAIQVLEGVDVARYDGDIDWEQVAANGIRFAIIRVGFRGYSESGSLNQDMYFSANMVGAKEAGIARGVYFYSQAVTVEEAEEEAEYVLYILSGCNLELPVCMDVEYHEEGGRFDGRFYKAHLSPHEKVVICKAFCDRIEAAGYQAMIYANFQMLSAGMGEELDRMGISIWLAHWREHTTCYNGNYEFWQYTRDGVVPGIKTPVHRSRWYLSAEALNVFQLRNAPYPQIINAVRQQQEDWGIVRKEIDQLIREAGATACALYNSTTGQFLYENNGDTRLPIASITKIVTVLTTLEEISDPNQVLLTMDQESLDAVYPFGPSLAGFQDYVGSSIPITDYLYGTLLSSGCEAAYRLARYLGDGDVNAFVDRMNLLAERIGCKDTHFLDPAGLTDRGQYSTVRDISRIMDFAMRVPAFRRIITTYRHVADGRPDWVMETTNSLNLSFTGSFFAYAVGGKTGTTNGAGRCLCCTFERLGQEYIFVLLGVPFIRSLKLKQVYFRHTVSGIICASFAGRGPFMRVVFPEHYLTADVGTRLILEPKTLINNTADVPSLRFFSTNPDIASVDENGVVTILKSGVAQIELVTQTGDYDLLFVNSTGYENVELRRVRTPSLQTYG